MSDHPSNFVCTCGHELIHHCPFDGKLSPVEQWCGIVDCWGKSGCKDFRADNLRYLENLSES